MFGKSSSSVGKRSSDILSTCGTLEVLLFPPRFIIEEGFLRESVRSGISSLIIWQIQGEFVEEGKRRRWILEAERVLKYNFDNAVSA